MIDVGNIGELQALVDSGQFDVLYSSLPYDLYRLDMRGIELVATVHGLRHLEMPADILSSAAAIASIW